MNWLDTQVSLYSTYADNVGRPRSFRQILLSDFGGDIDIILALRQLDRSNPNYKKGKGEMKGLLQCYTPAALLETKAKGQVKEISRSGIMQLDFDCDDISDFDIEELKNCVFNLPCVGFCGLSPSGDGFYALVLISEPERLAEYAQHCFDVLFTMGIIVDQSKGKKVENLRFISYDQNMLIRDDPDPLLIKKFYLPKKELSKAVIIKTYKGNDAIVNNGLQLIRSVTNGRRWATVQRVSYTFGGLCDNNLLDAIKSEIDNNSEFTGQEQKYYKCAEDCFEDGHNKPFNNVARTI